ncbi:U1 small nuclear ribonucleoprotein C isoform X2 [Myiozetetes cayanensis]|uniref:U1 small nuclear ribonucleoprotein C isoform X2 n=1 Tax=Myiozetetes cayanensis TaxID=478635 RepID=UPI00215EDC85|nr:U1 small nuclear ribonucleoprotein C isoform X2 [Myiozetetes cayanensis]
MPKFYCDYCDTYLTHDSPSVRKTHCSGRKHKENVKDYYQKWMEEQAQSLIDKTSVTEARQRVLCQFLGPPSPCFLLRNGSSLCGIRTPDWLCGSSPWITGYLQLGRAPQDHCPHSQVHAGQPETKPCGSEHHPGAP